MTSEDIAKQTEEFIKKGGEITRLESDQVKPSHYRASVSIADD